MVTKLKIALAQLNPLVGDVVGNTKKLIDVRSKLDKDVDILVAPELYISGYPIDDLVLREDFLDLVNKEINNLKNLKIIVALGKIAFDACIYFYKTNYNYTQKVKFEHGKIFKITEKILLLGCYHPSPRNVNTGRINEKKMTDLFKKVLQLI